MFCNKGMNKKEKIKSTCFSKYISQVVLLFSLVVCFIGNVSILNKNTYLNSTFSYTNPTASGEIQLQQKHNIPEQSSFAEIENEVEEEEDDNDDDDKFIELVSSENQLEFLNSSNTKLTSKCNTGSLSRPLYLIFHCWKDNLN